MRDGVNVDFGLLGKPPDFVGDYANAFQLGRQMAQPPRKPPGAAENPGPTAPGTAPDPAAAVAAMSEEQRQSAAVKAQALATMLTGLKGASADPVQRLAMARHVAMRNPALGIAPGTITGADVTDAGLDTHLAAIQALHAMLQAPGPA